MLDRLQTTTRSGPPSALARNTVIGAILVLVVAGYVATAGGPVLLSNHPLVFIGLSSINRNLALASHDLSSWSYYLVGFLRLMAPDPLFFLLGRWYGDAGVRWLERRSPTYGRLVAQLERWFHQARYPFVLVMPNNPVSLFAGASTMSWGAFLAADVVGTVGRLYLIRRFSEVFEDLLKPIREFISDYRIPLLVVSVVAVVVTIVMEARAGRGQIEDLVHFDEEIEEAVDELEADAAAAVDDDERSAEDVRSVGGDASADGARRDGDRDPGGPSPR